MGTNKHQRLRWQQAEITIGDTVIPLSVARTENRETLALSVRPDGDVSVVAPKGERLSHIIDWRLLERIMPDYESRRIRLALEGARFQL